MKVVTAMLVLAACRSSETPPVRHVTADTADTATTQPPTGPTGTRHHPAKYTRAVNHGRAANLHEETCTDCHGEYLRGGTAGVSCDKCHDPGWSTDCTFCHGGELDSTGAPPQDIDDEADPDLITFPAHPAHATPRLSAPMDCAECHLRPRSVYTPGHLWDDTPQLAEVDFSAGLSALAIWNRAGSCSDAYCHGNGQGDNGAWSIADGPVDCASCHAYLTSPSTDWQTMSARHASHLDRGARCADCHAATDDGAGGMADPALHVDGLAQVAFADPSLTWDAADGTCSGSCHGVPHGGTWDGPGGSIHPAGWSDPAQHGIAANLKQLDCTTCHGADLTGGSSGQSCDTCHASGWRTDCTFCHGGTDNGTGAPPEDIDNTTTTALLSFAAHTRHVTDGIALASDCDECHVTPTSALDAEHMFDATAAMAEVDFTGGVLSHTATYDGSASCSNLYCHGNGQGDNGAWSVADGTVDCASCHAYLGSPTADLEAMSDRHASHLAGGAECVDCHADTDDGAGGIADHTLHVNRDVDVAFTASGFTFAGDTCSGTCHGVDHDGYWDTTLGYHPSGTWADAGEHGQSANLHQQDCTACHGADLAGGSSGQSCDTCHASGWRTDCTFCHGGTDNGTGAPPEDIDNTTSAASLSFGAHTRHVTDGIALASDCDECHVTPTSALDAAHMFDATAAIAEVDFTGGILSATATYDGSASCSNLYCHGNGQGDNGSWSVADGAVDCASCHAYLGSSTTEWEAMSDRHASHLAGGAECVDCHADTDDGAGGIADPAVHVDGDADVAFTAAGFSYTSGVCAGTCHGVGHDGNWDESLGYHPSSTWGDASEHGLASNLHQQSCTACHGADLTGGSSGQSCDSCHATGWRSDCTFCHGGTLDSTGAPPEDIDDEATVASITFPPHPDHVQATISQDWECTECHATPTSMLDAGHVYDATAGIAETDFSDGLSSSASWDATTSTCSDSYCHGDGQGDNGVWGVSDGSPGCSDCHPDASSSSNAWDGMSGRHKKHLEEPFGCDECHVDTDDGTGAAILYRSVHVDGVPTVVFSSSSISYSGGRCTGTCHGESHSDSW